MGAVSDAPVLLAVDGNSLLHRSYHALAATGARTAGGEPIWAIRGLLTQLVAAADRVGTSGDRCRIRHNDLIADGHSEVIE